MSKVIFDFLSFIIMFPITIIAIRGLKKMIRRSYVL